jgi:hypothetical protein
MASARCRSGPSPKLAKMIDSPAGAVNPAVTPLRKRLAISTPPPVARPPAADMTAKPASATRNTRRRPTTSAARPPSRKNPP